MKVFRLITGDTGVVSDTYYGTLSETKRAAKGVDKSERTNAQVEEVDIQTDKAGVVAMLNGEAIIKDTLRVWGLTPRGALEQVQ